MRRNIQGITGEFNLAAYLNDEVLNRLVKASALVQVLRTAGVSNVNGKLLDEYAWALEGVLSEARELQTRLWEQVERE